MSLMKKSVVSLALAASVVTPVAFGASTAQAAAKAPSVARATTYVETYVTPKSGRIIARLRPTSNSGIAGYINANQSALYLGDAGYGWIKVGSEGLRISYVSKNLVNAYRKTCNTYNNNCYNS